MADSGVETQTIESIELNVDDNPNEDHIDIDITQVTEETHVVSGSDEELSRDEMVVITERDLDGMSESSKERSTEVSADINKVYEEWIFVDVNKSTFEIIIMNIIVVILLSYWAAFQIIMCSEM